MASRLCSAKGKTNSKSLYDCFSLCRQHLRSYRSEKERLPRIRILSYTPRWGRRNRTSYPCCSIFLKTAIPPFHVSLNSKRSRGTASFNNGAPSLNNCFVRPTSNRIRSAKCLLNSPPRGPFQYTQIGSYLQAGYTPSLHQIDP